MGKLLDALSPLFLDGAIERAKSFLARYDQQHKVHLLRLMRAKLGLRGEQPGDQMLIDQLLDMMRRTRADFTASFGQLSELTIEELQAQCLR